MEPSPFLKQLTDRLAHRSSEASVQKLLLDATILREWQLTTPATHQQRDAMLKLGSHWHVPQRANYKKRKPAEVARELEEKFIHAARQLAENETIFTRRAAKRTQEGDAKPTQEGDATSGAAKPTQEDDAKCGAAKLLQDGDASASNMEPSMSVKKWTDRLAHRSSEASVKKLLSDATILRDWQLMTPATNQQRDAMMQLGRHWHVPQKVHQKKRKPAEVAQELEENFIRTARQLAENKTIFPRRAAKPTQEGDATSGAAKPTQEG